MKPYVKYPLVLGVIAACSGLIIGSVYLISEPIIEENRVQTQNKAREEIYEGATFAQLERDLSSYTYLKEVYTATRDGGIVGYLYFAEGSNMYGSISLYVGVDADDIGTIHSISLTENTESFASTIRKWVREDLSQPVTDVSSIDVKCGATYGATIIRDSISESQSDYLKGGF